MDTDNHLDRIPPRQILPALLRSNMLRMILTKHIEINKMADRKANMLIAAASIVIAVVISQAQNGSRTSGILIMLVSSILAIIFALLVIIPKPQNKKNNYTNLLYYRDFRKLTEEEYVKEMKEMLLDREKMYEQYIRDIYQYGSQTLTTKYRYLTCGLIIFLIGLLVGGIKIIFNLAG